jgi:hypothetical protein
MKAADQEPLQHPGGEQGGVNVAGERFPLELTWLTGVSAPFRILGFVLHEWGRPKVQLLDFRKHAWVLKLFIRASRDRPPAGAGWEKESPA